jgi:lysophospholipase L1-like esterase
VTRFLALGDSYTIGEGVADEERWPNQLVDILRVRGAEITDLHIIARTAWSTDELFDAIAQEKPKGPFDLVSLMSGVNDQYRSRPVASFAAEFHNLLRRSKGLARNKSFRTIAISIPDWGATPFAEGRDRALISREVAAYNERAKALALQEGAQWVDVTEISRAMLTDQTLVAVDGLHPTGAMYKRWAELIAPTALAALSA